MCGFCMQNSDFWTFWQRINKSLWVPDLTCPFVQSLTAWFAPEISSLYWFQPSFVVLCLQNSDFRTRLASLYGSQTSSVVLSLDITAYFSTSITSLYVSQPSSVVFACKTAHFGPEFQVSMGPSPHLCFLHAKQRFLDRNYKSLWVPDLTCPFVQSKRRDLHQNITSLYWFQPSSVVLCLQNSDFWTGITSL